MVDQISRLKKEIEGLKKKPTKLPNGKFVVGESRHKVTWVEEADAVHLNGAKLLKRDLAAVCNCKPDEMCWSVGLSVQPLPGAVRMCQTPGLPGHESVRSKQHAFTASQHTELQKLYKLASAANKRRK